MKNQLSEIIQQIEDYCDQHKLNHRFVGGVSYGGLLNKKTTYDISITEKKVILQNHNPLTLLRNDQTIRDIDMILFCEDMKKFLAFKQFLIDIEQASWKQHKPFPLVSVENAIYETLGIRNPMNQFVTSLEVDKKNNVYLTFDDITQQIHWDSVEPWHVVLENGATFTTRNPIADYFAYQYRAPGGIKPKDIKKLVYLKILAEAVTEAGTKNTPAVNYFSEHYYLPWKDYIKKLDITTHPRIKVKKFLLVLYWTTIGTTLAHGKGALRYLLIFSNRFTGIRQ